MPFPHAATASIWHVSLQPSLPLTLHTPSSSVPALLSGPRQKLREGFTLSKRQYSPVVHLPPSSHCSPAERTSSPQRPPEANVNPASRTQLAEQPSPFITRPYRTVLSSSHVSPGSMRSLPQSWSVQEPEHASRTKGG